MPPHPSSYRCVLKLDKNTDVMKKEKICCEKREKTTSYEVGKLYTTTTEADEDFFYFFFQRCVYTLRKVFIENINTRLARGCTWYRDNIGVCI